MLLSTTADNYLEHELSHMCSFREANQDCRNLIDQLSLHFMIFTRTYASYPFNIVCLSERLSLYSLQ